MMTKQDFVARFVAEMMTAAPIYDGTEDELRAYALEAAPTYYEDEDQRADGPEACAQSDIGYWEEG
jgi:hypothetical protein